ncbi:MAG: histidine--tRNA ligase [Candidatus Thermoplasmatota archaeon]|nr:histidine--tRNA ligase [Candidatus Thermoplasmatota archaeon]
MYQIPRGTRDFTSSEMQKRLLVENKIRTTFKKFGYNEVQTPVFETLELFTAKSGEGIINEIYSFQDKGGRDLALRPELTAPVMRMYIDRLQMEPKPLKLFYFGNCYRYDRPQKGRYREFKQAGCELIGVDTPEGYAELISMGYKILENIGLKNIQLNIGNLNILSAMFKKLNLSEDKQKYLVPLIDKSMFEDVLVALKDFKINPNVAAEFIDILTTNDFKKISEYIKEDTTIKEEINNLNKVLDFLKNSFKIKNFNIKISIVRGLDYYKGIVFEIEAPTLGAEKQLCGGGAYELIPSFGGSQTPTSGFAIGFDRAIIALETEEYKFPVEKLDIFIIPVNEDMVNKSLEIAETLRKNLKVDIDLMRRGISKSLKYASAINAQKTIIIGLKELEEKSVTVRDMNTGKQEKILIEKLEGYLLK